jgi:putative tryptophan/tyrosine transport system ATP-binding protein
MDATCIQNVRSNKEMNLNNKKAVLKIEDVHKVFFPGTVDEVQALQGVNIEVHDGDFICIIGSNGAGKSTALNVVAGVFPPEKGGKVFINQKDVTRLPEYKHAAFVGRVWQQPGVGTAANLSIEENLSMAVMRGKKRGLKMALNSSRKKMYQEALATLDLGLENRLSASVGTLSGGQRQALSLIMATISKPSILLLDEHIATLDPKTASIVMELTDKVIRKENMTSMMVTHNMEMALKYGNRLVMMHKGKIAVDISKEEKEKLTIEDLISSFQKAAGEIFHDDKILLSNV